MALDRLIAIEAEVPVDLVLASADAAVTSGLGPEADALLDPAQTHLSDLPPSKEGSLLLRQSRRLHQRGQGDAALDCFERARKAFGLAGQEREATIARGEIADVFEMRGDLEEALRIRREEQLPVFERLGDLRSAAVTKGKIADVVQMRGDLEEALRIRREEELPVYERLGDLRGKSVALFAIGRLLLSKGDPGQREVHGALNAFSEAFQIARSLGIADGIGAVGLNLAALLAQIGQPDPAEEILAAAEEAFHRLSEPNGLEAVRSVRAMIEAARGQG